MLSRNPKYSLEKENCESLFLNHLFDLLMARIMNIIHHKVCCKQKARLVFRNMVLTVVFDLKEKITLFFLNTFSRLYLAYVERIFPLPVLLFLWNRKCYARNLTQLHMLFDILSFHKLANNCLEMRHTLIKKLNNPFGERSSSVLRFNKLRLARTNVRGPVGWT